MADIETIGGAIHNEEMKVESYFKTHVVATAIGSAVAAALLVLSIAILFKI